MTISKDCGTGEIWLECDGCPARGPRGKDRDKQNDELRAEGWTINQRDHLCPRCSKKSAVA